MYIFIFAETVFKFKALKKVAQLAVINSLEKASMLWACDPCFRSNLIPLHVQQGIIWSLYLNHRLFASCVVRLLMETQGRFKN